MRISFFFFAFVWPFFRVFIKCGPVSFIHIDNKIIGGFALENSDGVNLFVGWGDSILYVGCLASCCLGVFIVGGGFVCS